jgi:hypothetical protein
MAQPHNRSKKEKIPNEQRSNTTKKSRIKPMRDFFVVITRCARFFETKEGGGHGSR